MLKKLEILSMLCKKKKTCPEQRKWDFLSKNHPIPIFKETLHGGEPLSLLALPSIHGFKTFGLL